MQTIVNCQLVLLKLYLVADVGFDIRPYFGTITRRFPLLGVGPPIDPQNQPGQNAGQKAIEYLHNCCMDRTLTVLVYKGMDPNYEYAVELLDKTSHKNFNQEMIDLGLVERM